MYSETPRRLILAGILSTAEMANLTEYCDRLHDSGQADLTLQMSSVSDCHRAGLDGLVALIGGSSGMAVTVEGARWSQFFVMLSGAPIADLQELCDSVRGVLAQAPAG